MSEEKSKVLEKRLMPGKYRQTFFLFPVMKLGPVVRKLLPSSRKKVTSPIKLKMLCVCLKRAVLKFARQATFDEQRRNAMAIADFLRINDAKLAK
jgi:hypothetical protein